MNIVKTLEQYNDNCVYFCDPIKNNIMKTNILGLPVKESELIVTELNILLSNYFHSKNNNNYIIEIL